MSKRIALFGASGGVESSIGKYLVRQNYKVHCLSRKKVDFGFWKKMDLSNLEEMKSLQETYQDTSFVALIYAAGTWEKDAFTKDYTFLGTSLEDNLNVVNINLYAPIQLAKVFGKRRWRENYILGCVIWPGSLWFQRSCQYCN